MLRERARMVTRISVITDVIIELVAFYLAHWVRNTFLIGLAWEVMGKVYVVHERELASQDLWLLVMIIPFSLYLFRHYGAYESARLKSFGMVMSGYLSGILAMLIFLVLMHDVFVQLRISRLLSVLFLGFTALLIAIKEQVLFFAMHHFRGMGFNFRNVLIVGSGPRAMEVVDALKEHPEWGLRLVGFVDPDPNRVGKEYGGHVVVGSVDDLPQTLDENVVDEVIIAMPRSWFQLVEKVLRTCETSGIRAHLRFDLFNPKIAKPVFHDLFGFHLLSFETTSMHDIQLLVKRGFDVGASLILILLFAPLMIAVALLVKLTSPGPVFFKQERMGLNGRRFMMYKFRSMYVDAEERLTELEDQNEMTGPVFKISDDPRVTPVGRFIRKFSIDELPQLFNVFKGEMSLVGPRPPVYREVVEYQRWQRRRLSMRPGITCIWQVSGRNDIDFEEWMELDLEYIDNWSFWLDLKLLFKTIPAVLAGKGAH
ncbi:MAG: sugar transferase [Deltaproteobacteria bacterium]|nr:sugar transferase [Deltaproteobacteria bacterium]